MDEASEIVVEARDGTGKGAARAARRAGMVPGVVYGDKKPSAAISLSRRTLERELNSGAFFSTLYELKLDDRRQKVLPRDVQRHPVTDMPLHVDFLRLAADARVTIEVPVQFVNEEESEGLKRGGVLNVVRYDIEVSCRADAIPERIEVDLAGTDIGDSVHISAVKLPDGVEPTITDRDFTIATIAAPTVQEEEAPAEGEEGAEEAAAEAAGEEAPAEGDGDESTD